MTAKGQPPSPRTGCFAEAVGAMELRIRGLPSATLQYRVLWRMMSGFGQRGDPRLLPFLPESIPLIANAPFLAQIVSEALSTGGLRRFDKVLPHTRDGLHLTLFRGKFGQLTQELSRGIVAEFAVDIEE